MTISEEFCKMLLGRACNIAEASRENTSDGSIRVEVERIQ
jgi:hypothetical protein